jgi:hypothetical protein
MQFGVASLVLRKGYALGASEYAVDPATAVFMSISCATL